MAWLDSKGRRVEVVCKGGTLALHIVMLLASHLGRSNRVDYMSFLVFGVIRWCPRACWNKCTMVPR